MAVVALVAYAFLVVMVFNPVAQFFGFATHGVYLLFLLVGLFIFFCACCAGCNTPRRTYRRYNYDNWNRDNYGKRFHYRDEDEEWWYIKICSALGSLKMKAPSSGSPCSLTYAAVALTIS